MFLMFGKIARFTGVFAVRHLVCGCPAAVITVDSDWHRSVVRSVGRWLV